MPSAPHRELPVIASSLVEDRATQRGEAVRQIRSALLELGCFVLQIEGAAPAIHAAIQQWRNLYAKPLDVKRACQSARDEESGWLRLRDEPVYMSHMKASEREAARCKEQFGCSGLEDAGRWPNDVACPGYRRDVSACARRLEGASRSLLASFEALLGQDPGFLRYAPGYLTLTSYPARLQVRSQAPTSDGGGAFGLQEHSDAVIFTLLRQTVAALEVKTTAGDWLPVPVLPEDSFLVIPGDWMELLTNGLIPAVRHRVLDIAHDREAIAFFQNVARMPIGPLRSFLVDGAGARYPTVDSDMPYAGGDAGVPRWQTRANAPS